MLHDLDSTTLRIYNCDSFINDDISILGVAYIVSLYCISIFIYLYILLLSMIKEYDLFEFRALNLKKTKTVLAVNGILFCLSFDAFAIRINIF